MIDTRGGIVKCDKGGGNGALKITKRGEVILTPQATRTGLPGRVSRPSAFAVLLPPPSVELQSRLVGPSKKKLRPPPRH